MKNPIKPTAKTEFLPVLIILISLGLSFYFYNNLPAQIPVHWNFAGEVDKTGSSLGMTLGMPALLLGFYALFLILPLIDPKKKRYDEFRKVYHAFKLIILSLFFLLYLLVGLSGLGYNIPVGVVVPVAIGILFILLGNYLGKVKSNWFLGIKTPWTLSSEEVWNKTHRLGGKTFILGGILLILEPLFPVNWRLPVFIFLILLAAVTPIVYSYILYKKETKE